MIFSVLAAVNGRPTSTPAQASVYYRISEGAVYRSPFGESSGNKTGATASNGRAHSLCPRGGTGRRDPPAKRVLREEREGSNPSGPTLSLGRPTFLR